MLVSLETSDPMQDHQPKVQGRCLWRDNMVEHTGSPDHHQPKWNQMERNSVCTFHCWRRIRTWRHDQNGEILGLF